MRIGIKQAATHGKAAGAFTAQLSAFDWRIAMVAILLLLCFSLAYMGLGPSVSTQHYDSLAYGSGVETKGLSSIWGNHPLGHLILNTAFLAARHSGYEGRALPLFQVFNNLVGGLIVSLFFLISVAIFRNGLVSSVLMALALGGSASAWRFLGNTADIYSFAFLFSLIGWSALVYESYTGQRRMLLLSGLTVGLAILSHQLNVLLMLAGLVLIWIGGVDKGRRAMSFLTVAGLTVVLGYGALWFAIVQPTSPAGFVDWIRGYVGKPGWGLYLDWAWVQPAWAEATGALAFAGWTSRRFTVARALLLIPLGLALFFGFSRQHRLGSWRQHLIAAALVERVAFYLLILWWEPQNAKFWAVALVPFFVMLAAIAEAFQEAGQQLYSLLPASLKFYFRAVLFLPAIALCLFNVYTIAVPAHKVDNQGEIWSVRSERGDLLFPPWTAVAYLKYWADRPDTLELNRTLVAGRESAAVLSDLDRRISDTLCSRHKVLFSPLAIELRTDQEFAQVGATKTEFEAFFGRYSREEVFSYQAGDTTAQVYSLTGYADCPD